MSDLAEDAGFEARATSVMDILDKDPGLQDEQNTEDKAIDPASLSNAEQPDKDAIGEDQDKPKEAEKDEQQSAAIEPPVSWSSADKEAFSSLPTWSQELITRRESEREAHFGERAQAIASRERQVSDLERGAAEAQQRHLAELQRVSSLANQLLPAKFADIKDKSDYLRLKVDDPARASEFEAFMEIIGSSQAEASAIQQQRMKQHLDREYQTLQTKYPEFADTNKANTIMNDVRKTLVDNYGFTPQDVEIVADHRHIPIVRDAMAWRAYQSQLKAVASKKVPATQPARTLKPSGETPANASAEQKSKILNRARSSENLHTKADLIVRALNLS